MASTLNLPILSIPFYYVLAIFPHGWAINRASKGDMKRHDNRNPKGTSYHDALRKRLTVAEFAAFERAESCHRNHLENMPLYVAAVFAGLLAENRLGKDSIGLESFVYGWNLIRILYTANYLTTETRVWSYLRSLLYFAGTGWAFAILYRASKAFGEQN
ncbi:Putative membrane-associated, eicosanoid/glutathione metabolism (MAPEG) protein [Septoria linicola]|uniref:Membrane-associated, eicosanoid/glutathione metabolism (MAPEG) protein n=1 Tax=Septoria linicola TaxID=215465 RepID=A0A9Q9AX39_9PEZI|nr:putative membrane-associated, eicosanoid/glutathione metabolism (MAPEG) protein [Septoria linicola]USW57034.1 Putative membrane-associated, eicosanoid/glutathione metabolism (MAPEG) protein [Septoria linicola]